MRLSTAWVAAAAGAKVGVLSSVSCFNRLRSAGSVLFCVLTSPSKSLTQRRASSINYLPSPDESQGAALERRAVCNPHIYDGFRKSITYYYGHMELWHALNHGIEGRDLFLDSQDYARFVHDLYEFNDSAPAGNAYRLFDTSDVMDIVNPSFRKMREMLVNIHGWTLMKDHYHLLLSECVENGISLFLRKLNVGYANYVNQRYGRKGTLYRGRTKKVHIEREAHFLYILHYLHLNPLDYLSGAEMWRLRSKKGIRSLEESLNYLDTYRWSSYLDYSGQKNFPSVLTTSLFNDALGNYNESLRMYLQDAEDDALANLILE